MFARRWLEITIWRFMLAKTKVTEGKNLVENISCFTKAIDIRNTSYWVTMNKSPIYLSDRISAFLFILCLSTTLLVHEPEHDNKYARFVCLVFIHLEKFSLKEGPYSTFLSLRPVFPWKYIRLLIHKTKKDPKYVCKHVAFYSRISRRCISHLRLSISTPISIWLFFFRKSVSKKLANWLIYSCTCQLCIKMSFLLTLH